MSGPNGINTTCVSFTGGKIYGAHYAVSLFSHNSVFSHNEIDHFGDDGIDYGANNLIITDNYIHDNLDIGDGNHADCMQGILGDRQSDRAEERQGRFLHRLLERRDREQPRHPADGSEARIPD